MKKENFFEVYEAPVVEIVEVQVEKGFAATGGNESVGGDIIDDFEWGW